MIIGIDASRSSRTQNTGVETYSNAMIQALLKQSKTPESYRLYTPKKIDFLDFNLQRVIPFPRAWTLIRLSIEMLLHPPDALFVPAHVLPFFSPKKSVVTLHDLAFEKNAKLYSFFQRIYLQWSTRRALKKAAHILVPSAAVEQDLQKFFPLQTKAKIHVIHHGLPELPKTLEQDQTALREKFGIKKTQKIFFFLGRLEPKKNILGLLKAWSLFQKEHDGVLVLGGSPKVKNEAIQKALQDPTFMKQVILTGYLSEKDLGAFLSMAQAFVFPSFEEGFGLPLLQSFAHNCPVICSKIPSLEEVGGDACFYIDPEKAEDLAHAMAQILENNVRDHFVKKGQEQVKGFSWEKAAQKVCKILES